MNIEIANKLLQLRKEKGLSQEQLAQKLGISRQAISKWERAEASPDTDNLIELTPAQHKEITRIYSSITSYSEGVRVRDWLAGKSFELQYQFGIGKLKELGIMK